MKRALLFALFIISLMIPAYPVAAGTIEPDLSQAISTAEPGDMIGVIVLMRDSFDVQGVRGDYMKVVTGLRSAADTSQADLSGILSGYEASGQVSDIKRFWIVNAIAVKAAAAVIEEIAQRPDVEQVTLDKIMTIPTPIIDEHIQAVGWNISKVRAPEVWTMGYNGTGVVVANIDTGVDVSHPTLSSKYRGGGNSWYDAVNGLPSPYDDNGHGTHTMGTMAGDDGGSNQIGVAPGSRFIAAKACDGGGSCASSWLLAAGQWAMDPDGNPATPDYPTVINNSWGGVGCDTWYQTAVINWRAAGIFPSFSAGNSGPGSGTVGSPGDYPVSFATGATDISDVIASFSSRGPSCFAEIKPEVSAPGVSIRSSLPGGSYGSWSGTSMAAPHVSGCVALLRQIDPALTVDELEIALESAAVDLGTPGKDNVYGSGRIDCYEAALAIGAPPPVNGPDLLVTQLTAPSSATKGQSISVSNTVANQGNQTAAYSKAGFYLSPNNNPSIAPSDVFLGSRDVPQQAGGVIRKTEGSDVFVDATNLPPGGASMASTKLSIPSATTVGIYYVKLRADYLGTVAETNENNNISASGTVNVQAGSLPPGRR